MDSEKLIILFEMKKDRLRNFLLNNYIIYPFVNKFSALL